MPTNAELIKQSKKYKMLSMDSDEEEGRSEIQMKSSKKKDKRYVLHVYGISFPFDYITLLVMQKRRQRPKQ
jgi:hypothetical protein